MISKNKDKQPIIEGEPYIRTEEWFDWKKNGRKCAGTGVKDRTY